MVTLVGAGYGVWYRPLDEMVPALPVPDATATVHVTVVGLSPVTVALNCCDCPIVTFPPAGEMEMLA
jgi:hypothetical protein